MELARNSTLRRQEPQLASIKSAPQKSLAYRTPSPTTSLLVLVNINNGCCKAAYLFLRVLPRGNFLGSVQFSQISTHEVIRVILLT